MKLDKITILGPAWPYRGGLAAIMETLARTFMARGAQVDIQTFTLQYPAFLFPGKSQLTDTQAPKGVHIERSVNTINPFNWLRVGLRIRRAAPQMLLLKYWTPFMGPCFGTIARLARGNGVTKVLVQLDNVIPHEHSMIDTPFTRYFLGSCDGFIYMSEQVNRDLHRFEKRKPALFSPHPLFSNFGDPVSREAACEELGLDPQVRYSLFFGLVRDYKGLDLLLDAWAQLENKGEKLIVAGEFYTDKQKYLDQIARLGLGEQVILHDHFIRDELVRYYFCAADVLIQPYHTATQSGVTQIAYHFELPMIVTDVGGLAEIVPDDVVGYVCDTTAESVSAAIEKIRKPGVLERFRRNMKTEKKRFSWEATADKLEELYSLTLK